MFKNAFLQDLRTAVIVVTMQEHFLQFYDETTTAKLVANQRRVLQTASSNALPIVFLEDSQLVGQATLPELAQAAPYAQVIKEFMNIPLHLNALFTQQLKRKGVRHVFIMGVYTGQYVLETAQYAYNKGYSVATSEAVIAARSEIDHTYLEDEFARFGSIEILEPADT